MEMDEWMNAMENKWDWEWEQKQTKTKHKQKWNEMKWINRTQSHFHTPKFKDCVWIWCDLKWHQKEDREHTREEKKTHTSSELFLTHTLAQCAGSTVSLAIHID